MKALLLDALGTLVRLDDPVGRLQRAAGLSREDAAQRMRAEIDYYRAEHHRAGTREGLTELREECARIAGVEVDVLLEAIHFEPYPEVEGVLDRCAERGIALAVVSNWDVSLHDVLAQLGWTERFEAVITSAELGVAKPDPRPFLTALRLLDVAPQHAVHVGDDLDADVRGAEAAGIRGLLLDRTVASLDEVLD